MMMPRDRGGPRSRIVRLPDVQAKIPDFGFEPLCDKNRTPCAIVNAQADRWAAAVKAVGIALQQFTWCPSRHLRGCSRPSIRPDHSPDCGIEQRPHRILSFKCRKSLQQQKAHVSAGRNMIAASSKGDMLDDGAIHLSNDQPKARSMEKTSNAKASSGKKSPVNIERQLGAAADQSMPSTS
ncbi:hypothetical protein [Bradyrhizobium sp. AZCC 1693]|uniref:hypothetical protein n=1 Tax=Bradyrhizobium sp. AZCC 1693 TaxID=3117029 RepID=UPI002FF28CF6